MADRNLKHYFNANPTKPPSTASAESEMKDHVTLNETCDESQSVEIIGRRRRTATGSKAKYVEDKESDDDFENDPIMPPLNGNSITKYFSPVDKESISRKTKVKPCVMTVQAQVHDSPKKVPKLVLKKVTSKKKKKKKVGISGSQADVIEFVSSEELPAVNTDNITTHLTKQPGSFGTPSVLPISNAELETADSSASKKPCRNKINWTMRNCLEENIKSSDGDEIADGDVKNEGGPRRSTRIKVKRVCVEDSDNFEDETRDTVKKVSNNKKRKKEKKLTEVVDDEDDDEVEIILEDVAPIFLKKKRQEEVRALKKAKQDFLFSGVPEVLKQQTLVQQALEQRLVEIFPRVNHVTQAGSRPWQLPYPDSLEKILLSKSQEELLIQQPLTFSSSLNEPAVAIVPTQSTSTSRSIEKQATSLDWRYCKNHITKLKEEHGLAFPFFRTLKALLSKTNRENGTFLWTDAYAPTCATDFLSVNRKSVNQLKTWLNQWKVKAGEEIIPEPNKKAKATNKKLSKRKRIDSEETDPDEFLVDEKSNASWKSERTGSEDRLCNCFLLVGPPGCGKTASVYALAEELGYNVLEVNASSRRNGKTVLSHLQEATQSHSLNNNNNSSSNSTMANSMNKLFFGAKAPVSRKPSSPKPEDPKALSLVLFEDVDIVFESEDESADPSSDSGFYSALTTLLQTSKRPVIMTLSNIEERALLTIQDKVKSYFEVVDLISPDLPSVCGYFWSLCLAEGYPLNWSSLEGWLKSSSRVELDLRSRLLDLQFLLEHHSKRLTLNFNQLQLKNEDEAPTQKGRIESNGDAGHTICIQLIDLPLHHTSDEWPCYKPTPKLKRYTYDSEQDIINVTDCKKKRFSRIIQDDNLFESDSNEQMDLVEEAVNHPQPKPERWSGDLSPLVDCLHLRATRELLQFGLSRSDLSWNDAHCIHDIEQFLTRRNVTLVEKEWSGMSKISFDEKISQQIESEAMISANESLIESSVSKFMRLQRSSNSADVLPYLRSMCRSDLERGMEKRRRKPRSRETPSTRLPSLDLILSTPAVIQLANTFLN